MAIFETNASNNYSKLVLEVNERSNSSNITNNTSIVDWKVKIVRVNGRPWNNYGAPLWVYINGSEVFNNNVTFDLRNKSEQTLASGSRTITHNSDGSKSIWCSSTFNTNVSEGTISTSGSLDLSTIPRASTIGSISGNTLGQRCTVQINRKSSRFVHQCWWRINGGGWHEATSNASTSFSFTLSDSLASNFGNSTTAKIDLSIRTFDGNTRIGDDAYSYNHQIYLPGKSEISSVSASELGKSVTINMTKNCSAFTHSFWYRFAGGSWIEPKHKTSDNNCTFTLPIDLASRIPNSDSGLLELWIETFNGDYRIGDTKHSKNVTLSANIKPRLNSFTVAENNRKVTDVVGSSYLVETLSDLRARFTSHTGTYGSSIQNFKAVIVGKNKTATSDNGSFGLIDFNGRATIQAQVQDSRGRWSNTVEKTIDVLPYQPPTIYFTATRSGHDAQTITVQRHIKIAPLRVGDDQKNTMKLEFHTKASNSNVFSKNSGAGGTWRATSELKNSNANLSGTFSTMKAYDVKGILSDAFLSANYTVPVGVEKVLMFRSPLGTAFGKVWERGILDVAGDVYINGRNLLPKTHDGYSIHKGNADLNTLTKNEEMYLLSGTKNKPGSIGTTPMHAMYVGKNSGNGFQLGSSSAMSRKGLHYRMQDGNYWTNWETLATESDLSRKADKNSVQISKLTQDDGAYRRLNHINEVKRCGFALVGPSGMPTNTSYFVTSCVNTSGTGFHLAYNSNEGLHVKGYRSNDHWKKVATDEYTWHRVGSLYNGWTQYGGDYQLFEYTKDDTGMVSLRGNIKCSSSTFSGKIGWLPSGIAPPNALYFRVIHGNYETGYICIQGNGDITTRGTIKGSWLCFDGINYKI